MTTFAFPETVRPAEVRWRLQANSQSFESPLSGAEQTAELPGAKWVATLTFENLKRHEIADLETLVAKLRGRANRVTLWNHARENPRGQAGGTPLVAGAGQTGTQLNTDGWTAGSTVLLAGDMVGVNGELKIITADVTSDATGVAVLQFEPPLRYSPPDNAVITTTRASAKMMLADTRQGEIRSRRALNATSIVLVEDIT